MVTPACGFQVVRLSSHLFDPFYGSGVISMEPIRKLWHGVDTIKVGFGVAWPDSFAELLQTLDVHKQQAQEAMEPIVFSLCASKPFDQVVALHKGNKNARYGVQVEGLTIFFAARQLPHAETPNLYVEAGPEYVAENGVAALYAFVLEFIAHLGGQYLWNKVSEVHLTVDMEVDQPHTDEDYRKDGEFLFVTRARTKLPRYGYVEQTDEVEDQFQSASMVFKGSRLETMQIGKNQMMLRIYDKLAELARRPRKSWERLLWKNPEAQHVLRTEFQVRRESLKLLGFSTLEDVQARSGTLWAYLTQQWFRLYAKAQVTGHAQPIDVFHPFWLAVQEAWETVCEPAVRKKEFHELRLQRAQQLLGHATSLAAIVPPAPGKAVITVDDLMRLMRNLIEELLPEVDVAEKIDVKAVRFQCRNKADIGEDDLSADSSAMAEGDETRWDAGDGA
jgi:hypothetical protein